MQEKELAELLYRALKKGDVASTVSLLSQNLSSQKTEKLRFTRTPFLNSVGRELGRLLAPEEGWFEALMELWKASDRDAKLIVISALGRLSKTHYPEVKDFVLKILGEVSHWEICDQLALKVMVNLAVKQEEEIFSLLETWASSPNKWLRRLAAATVPPFIRAKKDRAHICLRLLEQLMEDRDRDVQKAVSWALREVTKKDPAAVHAFLKKHARGAGPATRRIIREGMKKLPPELQGEIKALMEGKNGK